MTDAIKALLHWPVATTEDSEAILPVLIFISVGLLIAICLALSFGMPPLDDFNLF